MKKIVGILGAAAVLATSVFAADVNAKVKVDGSILSFDKEGNFNALKVQHNSEGWNPDLAVSINGDNAGASMSFYYAGSGSKDNKFTTVSQSYSVWFKPIDMLKVTVGQYATNLNQETIDWSHSESAIDTQGIAVDFNTNGFFATLFFAPGWENNWLSKAKDQDLALGGLYFKAGYGADFGRVQALFRLVDTKNMWFGAAYDNTFGSVRMFVNALAGINTDKGFSVRGEAFATTNVDIVGLSVFVAGGYTADGVPSGLSGWKIAQPKKDKATLGATFKATFALSGCTPFIYVKDVNLLADAFEIEVKPGVGGNFGAMGWEVAVDMNFGKDLFKLNVPFWVSVAF